MPIVDIKGVGKAQFPDGMSVDSIRSFLQKKYAQGGQSSLLQPAPQTIEAYEPTLTEKFGRGIGDALTSTGLISDNYGAQRIGRNIAALGEFLPGVGDATAGDDFGRALAAGDYGGAALAGAGAIPILGDMAIFAGVLAKNADLGALRKAKMLEDTGADRGKIWKETGWTNDKGDWKFEISDALDFDTGKGADINPSSFGMIKDYGGTTQQNFLGHEDLYEAYPNLTDRPVRTTSGSGGSYSPSTDSIKMGETLLSPDSASALSEAQSVNLHEVQHAIQNREGFQSGGNPAEIERRDKIIRKDITSFEGVLNDRMDSLRGDKYYKDLQSDLMKSAEARDVDTMMEISAKQNSYLNDDSIVKQYKKDLHKMYGESPQISYVDQYMRLSGEAEARNVQTRMDWTPEQRRKTPPWESLDVPESELIYRK